MKKILLYTALLFCALACKEDGEFQEFSLKYEVNVTDEKTLPEYGLNETANISFDIKTLYDFDKVPMNIYLLSDKVAEYKVNGVSIDRDTKVSVNQSGIIEYTGKELGTHKLKIIFENGKSVNVIKEIKIHFVEHVFYVEYTGGKDEIYQGQEVLYTVSIKPTKPIEDEYKIMFVSYEEKDPKLEKSYVKLNGENITFNQWIELSDISNLKIVLNSFYFGDKNLVYRVKNKTSERSVSIPQTILKNRISSENFSLSKSETDYIEETLTLRGFLFKTPKLSSFVEYKTWVSSATNNQTDGIETTNNVYKADNISNNGEFILNFKTLKAGIYKLAIQFRDEFGNESEVEKFDLQVQSKDFEILQDTGDTSNLQQGVDFNILINIREKQPTEEEYVIVFKKFDDLDVHLQKSKIYLKDEAIVFGQEYSLSKRESNKIRLNSFNYGTKNLVYEIKNSATIQTKETEFTFKRAEISATEFTIDDTYIVAEPFTIATTINKTIKRQTQIFYKTWAEKQQCAILGYNCTYKKTDEINSTNALYQTQSIGVDDGKFVLSLTPTGIGKYKYYIQFKDEFGNESQVYELVFKVRNGIEIQVSDTAFGVSKHRAGIWGYSGYNYRMSFQTTIKATASNDALLREMVIQFPNKIYTVVDKGQHYSIEIKFKELKEPLHNVSEINRIFEKGFMDNVIVNEDNNNPTIFDLLKKEILEKYKVQIMIKDSKGRIQTKELGIDRLLDE
ncbi:hypothetical protein ACILDU_11180 [Capnocytophaga canimorsus]|uniref:hypothetical protein n=1 Tax=Capnocytophaga canimorsus TaxID=28188 RepID=UPI0037D8C765